MSVRVLPLRRILQSCCWPHSGQRYEVWQGARCVLRTDDLKVAQAKAEET